MNRTEILRKERERILKELNQGVSNKAKLLTSLMDIDYEMEELRQKKNGMHQMSTI